MPHLVTHRNRVSNLSSGDENAASHSRWETVNAFSYELGGAAFVVGSVFFFPALADKEAVGGWLFFVGSLLYLLVTGHDFLEVVKYWRTHHSERFADWIELLAGFCYSSGSLLFTLGSVMFLPSVDSVAFGSWCFIIGSAVFVLGGFINLLQVVEAPSLLYMQLFNVTVAQFIAGSALFLVATIPYLWHLNDIAQDTVRGLAAAEFLFASSLFFLGGIAIYFRKLVQNKLVAFCRAHGMGTMFIRALRSEIDEKSVLGKDYNHRCRNR